MGIDVRPVHTFLLLNLAAFALLPVVTSLPNIEEYRPPELALGQEVEGGLHMFRSLIFLTGALVILKIVKFRLSWIIDLAVFVSGYLFGSLFGIGLALGILVLALRKTRIIELFNASSAMTIVCFSLLIAPFMTPESAMLLMALLSLYDVLGVLYFPYIKFLWLQVTRDKRLDTLAIVFEKGMVGAGDYVLPIIFSLSFGPAGLFSVPFLALGFSPNQGLAKRHGAFPGIPFQALFAYGFYVLFS